jgi:Protein of unknown function (DUF3300)
MGKPPRASTIVGPRTRTEMSVMLIQRFNSLRCVAVSVLLTAATASAQAQQSDAPSFSKEQLEQLAAPIALHPDPLLSQILMASTYPTEVVQAARWVRENTKVTGQALQDAMQKQPWDPSVKALTAVPQTLQMMSDKLDWTQKLGDAFLGQQAELLAAVQVLRQRADAAGHLKSTDQQRVSKSSKTVGSTTTSVITIEPTNPDYLYVPIYDPRVCYGDWPYPAYEPFYWYPYGFTGSGIVAFAGAIAVGSALWGRVDWWRDRVNINTNRFNQFNRTNIADGTWRHDARHRGNVPYRDAKVAGQFGDAKRNAAREAYRGKAESGRRDLASTKAGKTGADKRVQSTAKSKLASQTKGKSVAAKSAATKSKVAKNKVAKRTTTAARSKQVARHKTAAQGQRLKGYTPMRAPQRSLRGTGGSHRVGARGGGGRGGGGRGRR